MQSMRRDLFRGRNARFVRATIVPWRPYPVVSHRWRRPVSNSRNQVRTLQPVRRNWPNEDRWGYLSQTPVHACKQRYHMTRHKDRCARRPRCDCIHSGGCWIRSFVRESVAVSFGLIGEFDTIITTLSFLDNERWTNVHFLRQILP